MDPSSNSCVSFNFSAAYDPIANHYLQPNNISNAAVQFTARKRSFGHFKTFPDYAGGQSPHHGPVHR
jgi:hypothetical protein